MTWTKNDVLECTAVFAQREFGFRTAVEIIEHDSRQVARGEIAEVGNVYGFGDQNSYLGLFAPASSRVKLCDWERTMNIKLIGSALAVFLLRSVVFAQDP